jgi:hypothetical protein
MGDEKGAGSREDYPLLCPGWATGSAKGKGGEKPDTGSGHLHFQANKFNSGLTETMQIGLFDYLEVITRNLEGNVMKLSLWVGIDMTWPLIILVGITFFIGILFPSR